MVKSQERTHNLGMVAGQKEGKLLVGDGMILKFLDMLKFKQETRPGGERARGRRSLWHLSKTVLDEPQAPGSLKTRFMSMGKPRFLLPAREQRQSTTAGLATAVLTSPQQVLDGLFSVLPGVT